MAPTRLDILGHWHARGQIDDAQLAAGRWLQRTYDRAGIGDHATIRLDIPLVASRRPGRLADDRLDARRALDAARAILGELDFGLLCRVIARGVAIDTEAKRWAGREPRLYLARRVRDGLSMLSRSREGA